MKVFAISDLHLSFSTDKPMDIFGESWDNYFDKISCYWMEKVGENDIVLIAGDISWAMGLNDAAIDIGHVNALSGKKVIIKGNHDYWWSSYSKVKSILPPEMYAVQNNCVKIGNVIIAGTRGWNKTSKEDDLKIYNRELGRMKLSLDSVEKIREEGDKVIVMTHYPPFNVDLSNNEMTDVISSYDVDAVVYGHLHGKDCRAERKVFKGKTCYYLTSCDLVDNQLVDILED